MTNWDQGYCPTCGAGLAPDASFCGNCGTSFTSTGSSWPGHDEYGGYGDRGYDAGYGNAGQPAPPGHQDPYGGGYEVGGTYPDEQGPHPAPGPYGQGDPYSQDAAYGPGDPYSQGAPYGQGDPYAGHAPYADDAPAATGSAAAAEPPVPAESDRDSRRSTPLLVLAGSLILAVSFLSPILMSDADDEDDGTNGDLDGAVPASGLTDGQVLLQQADEVPEGALLDVPELDMARTEEPDVPQEDVLHHVVTLPELASVQDTTSASLSAVTVTGTEPGAYAGHRQVSVCDRSILKDAVDAGELTIGADTYADLLGLESTDGINDFVDGLTPLRLRFDTRVTQHTMTDGDDPEPVQTVLQAGTGVLVDADGTPRISCNGANPLAAPDPVADDIDEETALDTDAWAVNADESWERFAPERVVTIAAGEGESDDFLYADIETTELVERPTGTNGNRDLGPGDIVAVVQWESSADLDLSVIDPNEALISTTLPEPENSRGRHAEDANRNCEDNMAGEERISWPGGDAPPGQYTVRVTGHAVGEGPADDDEVLYEADCGGNSADYRLTVRLYQQETVVEEGSVGDSETNEYTVTLGDAPAEDAAEGEDDPAEGDPAEGDAAEGESDSADEGE